MKKEKYKKSSSYKVGSKMVENNIGEELFKLEIEGSIESETKVLLKSKIKNDDKGEAGSLNSDHLM